MTPIFPNKGKPFLYSRTVLTIHDELNMKQEHFILKRIYLHLLSIALISLPLLGQTAKPDSAQTILKAAIIEAQSSEKNVLLIFHATWCGWCKRLETALNDTAIKSLIDKNYTIAMLDVKERGDKIQTYENPGGQKLLSDFGGVTAGLPFIVFLNGNGRMIANSNVMPKEQNIGTLVRKKKLLRL
jgi:thioredoxin-related protein